MSNIIKTKLVPVAALLAACVCSAQASGLDGATVDLAYYFPTSTSVYEENGTFTVPTADTVFFGQVEANVTDDQLIITTLVSSFFTPASFNGVVMTVVSGPTITSAVLDGASTLNPAGISIVGGDEILVNFSGDTLTPGAQTIVDINTSSSVPDGGTTLGLLGMGFTGLLGLKRKNK